MRAIGVTLLLLSILSLVLLVLTACTDEAGAKKAAEQMGMRDVKASGYGWFGCGRDDFWRTNFTATDSRGLPVRGVVCAGVLKGSTVRLYE